MLLLSVFPPCIGLCGRLVELPYHSMDSNGVPGMTYIDNMVHVVRQAALPSL